MPQMHTKNIVVGYDTVTNREFTPMDFLGNNYSVDQTAPVAKKYNDIIYQVVQVIYNSIDIDTIGFHTP